jgi:6-phosphogluconolactonase
MSETQDLAHRAAEWLLGAVNEGTGPVAVALSGGSTPKPFYALLVTKPFIDHVPWDRVHWFWGDERFVPPDDSRSNYRMAMDAMLRHAPVPHGHIHPVPTVGITPDAAAQQYELELQRFHGSSRLDGPFLFQANLLGIGTNGHFASLFPGTPALEERRRWVVPVTPAGEMTRITLTYPALESSRYAAFLVAGADKQEMLRRVRAGDASIPAGRYRPRGDLQFLTDAAAEHG